MPGPVRRPHSKSRRGCVPCKTRKVKCDEVRPTCGRCSTRGDSCHFQDNFSNQHVVNLSTPSSPPPIAAQSDSPMPTSDFFRTVLPSPQSSLSSDEGSTQIFRDRDLELLHHYTTSTCFTLSQVESSENFWQIEMPKLAFSNPMLMHGILAISACHLARLRPEASEYYLNIAVMHNTSAITAYRPLLHRISRENGPSLVAFSALLAALSLAMPLILPAQPSAVDFVINMVEMLGLIRGVKMVIACTWPWIQESSVQPLLNVDLEIFATRPLPSDARQVFDTLEARIRTEAESEVLQEAYLDGIKCMVKIYPRGKIERSIQSLLHAWPAIVSDSFWAAMVKRRPIALALLGIWAKLLLMMPNVWWSGDKGQKLVGAVSEMLPPGWEDLMGWLGTTAEATAGPSKQTTLPILGGPNIEVITS